MRRISLRKWSVLSVCLMIAVQVVIMVLFWGEPQGSDHGVYMEIARDCYDKGSWYPSASDAYSPYFWAPGFINFLILQLHMFGTFNLNMMFNFLFNLAILSEVCYLARKFFTPRTADISTIFFCLLYSNWFAVAPAGTEVPFLFLALTGFCLCLKPSWRNVVLASVCFALANWVRPLVVIFAVVAVLYMLKNKYSWKLYPALAIPFLALTVAFGWIAKANTGIFAPQASTSGFNLIMTANDAAYGGVATSIMDDTTSIAYIRDMDKHTFVEKDSIWKARSIEWIRENPGRYAKLYLLKIGGLFVEDSWPDRPMIGGSGFVDQAAHGKQSDNALLKRILHMAAGSIVFYIIGIAFLITIFRQRRDIFTPKGWLLLILLMGIGSTCLFAVSPRYHYPFMFAIILWAAFGIDKFLEKRRL